MPLLSVIIPHRNTEELLARLLMSIPTDPEIEVLVIDDHSRKSLKKSITVADNVKILETGDGSSGAGAARNIGLSVASGEWVIFADADDLFTPDAFNVLLDVTETSDHDIIYFPPESFHDTEGTISSRHIAYRHLVDEYLRYNSIWIRYRYHSPWSKLIRMSLIRTHSIKFDEVPVANDVLFSLKVGYHANNIHAIDKVVYRIAQSYTIGLSNQRSEEYFDIRLMTHIRYNNFLKQKNLKHYRMSATSLLKKSTQYGWRKFLKTTIYCIFRGQPIFDSFEYLQLLIRRRNNLATHQ